jgi:hypothetical protein
LTREDFTSAGPHKGWMLLRRAATPVTIGVDIDVPLGVT